MSHPKESKTSARRVLARQREQAAFDLRLACLTYEEIGAHFGVSKQAAHQMVKRVLTRIVKETEKDAKTLLTREEARIDAMIRAIWPDVLKGHLKSIDRVVKLMERRAKLLGLDAPSKKSIQAEIDARVGVQGKVHIYLPDNQRDKNGKAND